MKASTTSSRASGNTVNTANYLVIGSQSAMSPLVRRPVTITPISAAQQSQLSSRNQPSGSALSGAALIKKVMLKAVTRGKVKEFKLFTLRNVDPIKVSTCKDLIDLIRAQLSHDVVKDSFDVGFIQNNSPVSIRTGEDLFEIWQDLGKGKNITLWCDGMIPEKKKRTHESDSDDEHELRRNKRRKKDDTAREDKVEEIIQKLKAKHGDNGYTQMQYRVWSEMIAGGAYTSQDSPPQTTMFVRCGTPNTKRKTVSDRVVQAIWTRYQKHSHPKLLLLVPVLVQYSAVLVQYSAVLVEFLLLRLLRTARNVISSLLN